LTQRVTVESLAPTAWQNPDSDSNVFSLLKPKPS